MSTPCEYLVISRGQWDAGKSPEQIQAAIDAFYLWLEHHVAEGRMRRGSRLTLDRRVVSQAGITDGPFTETKEIIGGYWHILGGTLDEAAQLMAQNPTITCGLNFEVRQLEPARGSAFNVTNETPGRR